MRKVSPCSSSSRTWRWRSVSRIAPSGSKKAPSLRATRRRRCASSRTSAARTWASRLSNMRTMASEKDYLRVIANGLPLVAGKRKRVVVIGAGMAGLTAASELLRAGHDPLVLEAKQRVGGRVYTMRDPFTHGLYAEAGAMRIPRSHKLTLAYVEKFGLSTHDFRMSNPEGWCHLFGRKHRFREVEAKPHLIGAHLDDRERGATCAEMWERALKPFIDRLATSSDDAWAEIVGKFDAYSTREFLEEN